MNTEYTQFVATLLKRLAKLNYIKPGFVLLQINPGCF